MAFINIEGTISRVFYNGKGAEVTESFKKRDGSEGTKRYTLWFQSEHGLAEGDTGKFSGAVDVAVDEWQDKEGQTRHTAKVSVNNARIDSQGASQGAPDTRTGASNPDQWTTPQTGAGDFSGSVPF